MEETRPKYLEPFSVANIRSPGGCWVRQIWRPNSARSVSSGKSVSEPRLFATVAWNRVRAGAFPVRPPVEAESVCRNRRREHGKILLSGLIHTGKAIAWHADASGVKCL